MDVQATSVHLEHRKRVDDGSARESERTIPGGRPMRPRVGCSSGGKRA
jgi:hypothetical protein